MKLSTLVLSAAMMVAAIGAVSAVADTERHGMNSDAVKQKQTGRHAPLKRLLANVELTSEQSSQIKQLLQQHRSDARGTKTDAREQLQGLMQAENFDEQLARQILQQQQERRLERQLSRIKLQYQILQLLSPEQREQVQANVAKRGQRKMTQWHSS